MLIGLFAISFSRFAVTAILIYRVRTSIALSGMSHGATREFTVVITRTYKTL